ncbi:MAG: stage II sporulation protein M [Candidatus Aenigmarchaeota archaeon]|nr:stage II sporulation protein M [Candidatus Aenigmarchaeota archaeon]
MLESLLSWEEINDKPWLLFVWALIIGTVAVLISLQVSFEAGVAGSQVNLTGIFAIIFTEIPSIYLMTMLIKKEERLEEKYVREHYMKGFWIRHEKDAIMLLLYFAGLTLNFALWSFFLPPDTFQIQLEKINQIRGSVSGSATAAASSGILGFVSIFSNNMQVLLISFLFSFAFGAGAIFILTWNASILGVFIGQLSKTVWDIPAVSAAFLPHGIPEIAGYLIAGLGGGIISAAMIRKVPSGTLRIILLDGLKLLLVGALLIVFGALVEALVSGPALVVIFFAEVAVLAALFASITHKNPLEP